MNRPKVCDRARTYVSLRLDGELSEFERVLLDAHLEGCTSCHGFAVEVAGITAELRAAELDRLERPLILPQRVRAGFRRLQLGTAAAVLVTVVGAGALVGSVRGPDAQRLATLNAPTPQPTLRELRATDLRQAARVPGPTGVKILPA